MDGRRGATMSLPQGADYSLTENALIPFQAEPTHTVGRRPSSSHSFETGTLSTRCRLRMATFSSGVKCFRSFLIRSLRYLNGGTLSPVPTEAGQVSLASLSLNAD